MSHVLLYVAACLPTGKLYFGITSRGLRSRKAHLRSADRGTTAFARALRKHGTESFLWVELETYPTWEEACEAERHLISELDTTNPERGYNLTLGGEGQLGRTWTTRQRTAHLGRKNSETTKLKMRNSHLGKPSGLKGKSISETERVKRVGRKNRLGTSTSDQARKNMRDAHLGKPLSETTRKSMSLGQQRRREREALERLGFQNA